MTHYHGDRKIYNLIKIFSYKMLNNKMPNDYNIVGGSLKKPLSRNLGGLEMEKVV